MRRARSRFRPDEAGFTLVEVAAAMAILLIAITALARTATVAFTDIALARQRQTGNQLANQVLETVRGLPYRTVAKGLASSDVADDPRIVSCSDVYHYPSCTEGEPLVTTPGLPDTPPLVPHRGVVGPPDFSQQYRWGVYVTRAAGSPDEGMYRVTVEVRWDRVVRGGVANEVIVQTLVFSPEGCVDTETHPFGAPCQPYFYANGGVDPGSIVTTGTVDGLVFDSVSMELLATSADVQAEQVKRVEGSVGLPRAARVVGGAETSAGSAVASAADDDPSTQAGEYESVSVGPQAPVTLSVEGSGNALHVAVEGGSTGQTTSTVAANTTNACNLHVDDGPCGFATGNQGAIAQSLSIGGGVGAATLVSVAASSTPVTSFADQDTGTGAGRASQEVHRNLSDVRIGGLPSGLVSLPSGWQGYWVRLSGYSGSAAAGAGTGGVPTATVDGGVIEYWNGSGYTTTNVSTAGEELKIAPLDFSAGIGEGNTVRVQLSATLAVEPSSIHQTAAGTQVSRATLGAPLVGELAYRLRRNGVIVADLVVEVSLGRARAAAVYQPPPVPPE